MNLTELRALSKERLVRRVHTLEQQVNEQAVTIDVLRKQNSEDGIEIHRLREVILRYEKPTSRENIPQVADADRDPHRG